MSSRPKEFKSSFDRYTAGDVIGQGGSGLVCEARNESGNLVAVKCLYPEVVTSSKKLRFQNEINFCTKTNHKNIVKLVDSGSVTWKSKDVPFYVMPRYVCTLRELIDLKLEPAAALRGFVQLLDGMENAHTLNVFHRDLKPENIFVDVSSDNFIIADFGIAHFEEEFLVNAIDTKPFERLANIGYSAPEQRTRGQKVDHRADIYALAQILHEMFTGVIPEGTGYKKIQHTHTAYAYLDDLVDDMRQHDPDRRPQSVRDVKRELASRETVMSAARETATSAARELDELRRQLVSSPEPTIEPVEIVDAEWNSGVVRLRLNRRPEDRWVDLFQHPNASFGYVGSLDPLQYQFREGMVLISAEERHRQAVIDQFRQWAPIATERLSTELTEKARVEENRRRQKLLQEIERRERYLRVNSQLNF